MSSIDYNPLLLTDKEAEGAVLGSALYYPDSCNMLLNSLTVNSFYFENNRTIYKAMALYANIYGTERLTNDPDAFVKYCEEVLKTTKDFKFDCVRYLNNSPIPENIPSYVERLQLLERKRDVYRALMQGLQDITDPRNELDIIVNSCMESFKENGIKYSEGFVSATDVMLQVHEDVLRKSQLGIDEGIPLGFANIDFALGGLKKGQYVIVGARPSVGKTAFALSCILHMLNTEITTLRKEKDGNYTTGKKRVKVAFFSLEMPTRDIIKRLFSMHSHEPMWKVMNNKVESGDTAFFDDISNLYNEASGLYIHDSTTNLSINQLKAKLRALVDEKAVDICIIDYMSRIATTKEQGYQSWEKWTAISKELKSLALELDIPVVCLAQLNREAENSQPTLANLRDSGGIEQDADVVMLLHDPSRGSLKEKEQCNYKGTLLNNVKPIKCIVAKNRNGMTGDFDLAFIGEYALFDELDTVTTINGYPLEAREENNNKRSLR